MCVERDTVWDRLERAQAAPDWHQEEKCQIDERADLRHQVENVCWCLRTEVTQHDKVRKEDAVECLVPAWTVTDGLDRAVVQPRQEEHDDHSACLLYTSPSPRD